MMYRSPGHAGEVVYAAAPGCVREGCQLRAAKTVLDAAEAALLEVRRDRMSAALWCDQGGHAFSERDPGRQRISITVLDEEGAEHPETRDFCGECAEAAGLLSKRRTRPAADDALRGTGPAHFDPTYTRELERATGVDPAPGSPA